MSVGLQIMLGRPTYTQDISLIWRLPQKGESTWALWRITKWYQIACTINSFIVILTFSVDFQIIPRFCSINPYNAEITRYKS